ncbi:ninjurin-2-like [Ctenocephalides felis]|uniref:ninjurin-2-like n=1 Tax=Ctenocephalides felis TaxID=7515 RepID=UPI000E6E4F3E|nr:ninjurin-2-like [Ctenocephalides felis]
MWGFRLKQNMAAAISPELTTMNRDERLKSLDANRYATKKTIAQGMLDIALLTANASQLKYILQVGEKHEFYTLMLTLISISIILQCLQGIACVILGSALDINKLQQQDRANLGNNICLSLNIVTVVINVILSAFDMKYDSIRSMNNVSDFRNFTSS